MSEKTIRIEPRGSSPSVSAEAQARAKARIGTVVADRYRIDDLISESEIGAVYRAEHTRMRLRVALKILHPEAGAEAVARFEREAVAGAHIRHPNVAGATDSGVLEDGSHYLVVEHVAGTTLRDVLAKGPMPVARAGRIARQIALALSATHDQGIVHRDVEPRNVILTGEQGDDVKLIDFGLAKVDIERFSDPSPAQNLTDKGRVLTSMGTIVGTTAYLAPEAALGAEGVDARADLYALGVILYEMLAGKRPFDAEAPGALFAEQRTKKPPPIAERAPGVEVGPELEAVVMHLLDPDRTSRYATAAAASVALEAALRSGGLPSRAPGASASSAPPPGPAGFGILALRKGRGQPTGPLRRLTRGAVSWMEDASDWFLAGLPGFRKRWVPLRLPRWLPVVVVAGIPLVIVAFSVAAWRKGSSPVAPSSISGRVESLVPPVELPHESGGSAAPSSSGSAAPGAPEGDGAAWRAKLTEAVRAQNAENAGKAVAALAEADPAAFHDTAVVPAVVSAAVLVETTGGATSDALFHTLTSLGQDGLDVLFEIVRTRGGTKAYKRAAEILRDQDVAPLESPALRIAFELTEARCDQKRALFDRAVEEGDQRALGHLRGLLGMECDRRAKRRHSPCCFQEDPALAKAIRDLKARLDAK